MALKGGAIMPDCKNCKSKTIVKNGTARGKGNYIFNFGVGFGDERLMGGLGEAGREGMG